MQSFVIIAVLLSVAVAMVESTCNIFQTTSIQIDFCNYAEVIQSMVPGMLSQTQIQNCIAAMDKDMCRPVNDCTNSGVLVADSLALLDDILNDNSCTDPCTLSPCAHGTCNRVTSEQFTCSCQAGYSGTTCSTDVNECASTPCQNGGICLDQVASYSCSCSPGYTGTNCESDINECASNPCQNGGDCTDQVASYNCQCTPGYTGADCETDINECESNPCQNGGYCTDQVASYDCQCAPGFAGANCEIDVDECASSPCENGGICRNGIASFTCDCLPGYYGDFCEMDIDECESHPCQNSGICLDLVDSYVCQCEAGFSGVNCENNIDECLSSPCVNGGICEDGINSYSCICISGYEGINCEVDTDDCAFNPCANGGQCVDGVHSFTCICSDRYTGTTCEVPLNVGTGAACYTEADGSDYRGEANVTMSDYPCQNWANTHPNRPSNEAHLRFHNDANYCRNWRGSGKSGPWCYTNVEGVEWEYCSNVPQPCDACENKPSIEAVNVPADIETAYEAAECYTRTDGLDYTGYVSTTSGGYPCQRWDANYPNKRDPAKKSKPRHNTLLFGSHNYCRTNGVGPNGVTTGPWCWIADPAEVAKGNTWGYCDTANHLQAACPDKGTPEAQARMGVKPECNLVVKGFDYEGNVATAESGKPCIAWAELPSDNKYRGIFGDVGNKCRALDNSDRFNRPWCYTSQTAIEKCQVKDHYDQCFPAIGEAPSK